MAAPAIGQPATGSFPAFDSIRVTTPITGDKMTIWPGREPSRWDWVVGFPLELHPCAWDYMRISCDGRRVEIKPHYSESTWDTFWTDTRGHVTAQALGGLFPYTLGDQVDLIRGIIATLDSLVPLVGKESPATAKKIETIHDLLAGQAAPPTAGAVPPGLGRLRRKSAEIVWLHKTRKVRRAQAEGTAAR